VCRQRVFSIDEVEIDDMNFQLVVKKTKETFYVGDFVLDFNNKFRVCVQFHKSYIASFDYVKHLEILTTTLNILSIVSLVILLVLYSVVPGVRTLPGINVMNISFSLLFMQLTYTIANALQKSTLLCKVTGVMLHYFWLSLCCCLFVCSIHMFKSFRRCEVQRLLTKKQIRRAVLRRLSFCYLTPLFVVGLNIIITIAVKGNIGYGTSLCFVDNHIQNIVTFVVPLIVTCLTNVVMFILTVININFDKNISKSTSDMSELLIFVKLFILTGTVWILQVLDALLQISILSFIVTALTSSQGIFIFLSFSSSSKIQNYVKSLFKRKRKDLSTEKPMDNRKIDHICNTANS
jgi:hypothetical protein